MGFFSWKDCKDDESIASTYSEHPNKEKKVYLLQPNNEPNIVEPAYEGYGIFGGVDAYIWLAKHNMGHEVVGDDMDALREYGISIDCGNVYKDTKDGTYHMFLFAGSDYSTLDIEPFEGNYGTIQPKYNKTPNELIENGEWEKMDFISVVKEKFENFELTPLKITYDPDVKYEDVDASKHCPSQGFFYEEDEIRDALVKKAREDNKKAREKNKEQITTKSPKQ